MKQNFFQTAEPNSSATVHLKSYIHRYNDFYLNVHSYDDENIIRNANDKVKKCYLLISQKNGCVRTSVKKDERNRDIAQNHRIILSGDQKMIHEILNEKFTGQIEIMDTKPDLVECYDTFRNETYVGNGLSLIIEIDKSAKEYLESIKRGSNRFENINQIDCFFCDHSNGEFTHTRVIPENRHEYTSFPNV